MHIMDERMTSKQYRDMVASKGRRRGNPTAGPNKTEQAFYQHFADVGGATLIYEPIKLRIGPPGGRCWYTPDYMQTGQENPILWDVKAKAKDGGPRVEDDALVKIKAAAEKYRECFVFAIAWPDGNGGWHIRWF